MKPSQVVSWNFGPYSSGTPTSNSTLIRRPAGRVNRTPWRIAFASSRIRLFDAYVAHERRLVEACDAWEQHRLEPSRQHPRRCRQRQSDRIDTNIARRRKRPEYQDVEAVVDLLQQVGTPALQPEAGRSAERAWRICAGIAGSLAGEKKRTDGRGDGRSGRQPNHCAPDPERDRQTGADNEEGCGVGKLQPGVALVTLTRKENGVGVQVGEHRRNAHERHDREARGDAAEDRVVQEREDAEPDYERGQTEYECRGVGGSECLPDRPAATADLVDDPCRKAE